MKQVGLGGDPAGGVPRGAEGRGVARGVDRDARRLDRARGTRAASRATPVASRPATRAGSAATRAEIDAAADEVDAAAEEGEPERLSAALRGLDALWEAHLARRARPLWREYAESMLAAVLVALFLRGFVVEAFRIPSGSMVPTLAVGDHIFVSKLAYAIRVPFTHLRLVELGVPRRGDVIVFENPREPDKDYVKRVVGVPGDVLELREQVLYVNGVPQPRTHAGELAYEERSDATGALFTDTCRLYREALARGELARPDGDGAADAEASWQTARGRRRRHLRRPPVPPRAPRVSRGALRDRPPRPRVRARGQPRPLRRQPRRGRLAGAPRSRRRARHARVLELGRGRGLGGGGRGPRLERLFKRIE